MLVDLGLLLMLGIVLAVSWCERKRFAREIAQEKRLQDALSRYFPRE